MGARVSGLRFPSRSPELPASNCIRQSPQALVANTKDGTPDPAELLDRGQDNLPHVRRAEIARTRSFTLVSHAASLCTTTRFTLKSARMSLNGQAMRSQSLGRRSKPSSTPLL